MITQIDQITDVKQYIEDRKIEMGYRLREARTRAGLTQEDAAEILGVSRITINRVEQGHRQFTGLELEVLALAYNVPVTFFYSQVTSYPTAPPVRHEYGPAI